MSFADNLGLTLEGCRDRQDELRRHLERLKLDAALILDRRHVYYFTGYRQRSVFSMAALIETNGRTTLAAPLPVEQSVAADDVEVFASNRCCTLVDDQLEAACDVLQTRLSRHARLGCDSAVPIGLCPTARWVAIQESLMTMRRRKRSDEVALLRRAIAATEAAYQHARDNVSTKLTEVELAAGMFAAATAAAGEIVGEFGNDFQIGSVGSAPRARRPELGETAILDLSVVVRDYRSDMCRTFVVGGKPSDVQLTARERILEVIRLVEQTARPGVSCRQLFQTAHEMLDGFRGWSFSHHLGHGIGLSPHETPRLNPDWDDVLQVGDVVTAEPGLYGPDLQAGLRIEEIYLVNELGVERLSNFSTDLSSLSSPDVSRSRHPID